MPVVKILTLNLHCLVEEDLEVKQHRIANLIHEQQIDIVFFQEVAQTQTMTSVTDTIKDDNYALTIQRLLAGKNSDYHLYYKPIKTAFNKYDEGLAFLSKEKLTFDCAKRISHINDYSDWHTRYVLTYHVTIGSTKLYLANTHFGWTEGTERFENQFDAAFDTLPKNEIGILAGDFNVTPASSEYHHIVDRGLIDLFDVTEFRHRPTHMDYIDVHKKGSRIDYIMSTKPLDVVERRIVFDEHRVSDHYGVVVSFDVK